MGAAVGITLFDPFGAERPSEMILEIALFIASLAAIWQVRRWQLQSLRAQERYLRTFSEGVIAWRENPSIPEVAKEAIERLVGLPYDKKAMRLVTIRLLKDPGSEAKGSPYLKARLTLDKEAAEAFDWLLVTAFLAMTYSDWLTGWLLRGTRIWGLSKQTAAEVAGETIFSQNMARAVRA